MKDKVISKVNNKHLVIFLDLIVPYLHEKQENTDVGHLHGIS